MLIKRQWRKYLTWMAAIAVMLSSLLPAISHAVQREASRPAMHEICTAAGLQVVAVDADAGDDSRSGKHANHLGDCPYCRLHADAPGLLPAAAAAPLVVASGPAAPILFYQSRRPLFPWAHANPRAPPRYS